MSPIILRLRELRLARKWTQSDLADKAGAAISTISDIERGTTSRIDLELLERLAKALDVEPGALIVRESAKRPQRAQR
jgi:transcriptional regulator with XRE-family HTH domain